LRYETDLHSEIPATDTTTASELINCAVPFGTNSFPAIYYQIIESRYFFRADAYRDHGKSFIVTAGKKLPALLELERVTSFST
jgi:hypothetical protein